MGISTDYVGKFMPGSVFNTNAGFATVVGKKSRFRQAPLYLIEFCNTGSRKYVRGDALTSGKIKDGFATSVCGVASLGTQNRVNHLPEYTLWMSMIQRCYGDKGADPFYKDVTVCNRWLIFTNFVWDVGELEGYDLWRTLDNYQLDKDSIQPNNKVYSPSNCCFISGSDNAREAQLRKASYVKGLEEEVSRLRSLLVINGIMFDESE